jgi:hypothetical protein
MQWFALPNSRNGHAIALGDPLSSQVGIVHLPLIALLEELFTAVI